MVKAGDGHANFDTNCREKMAEIQAKIGRMVVVVILAILFLNGLTSSATEIQPIVSEVTYESIQRRLKDQPSLPPFCKYILSCSESSCNPPKICGTFYQSSMCYDP